VRECERVREREGESESETGGETSSRRRLQGRGARFGTVQYRNILDMNRGVGGFAAALYRDPVWVMNVIPVERQPPASIRKSGPRKKAMRGLRAGAGAGTGSEAGVEEREGTGAGAGAEAEGGGRFREERSSGLAGNEARRAAGGFLGVVYERGLLGTFHDWYCDPITPVLVQYSATVLFLSGGGSLAPSMTGS